MMKTFYEPIGSRMIESSVDVFTSEQLHELVSQSYSNWQPLSVVTVEGTPNRDIQVLMNMQARDSAVISVSRTASGQ